MLTLPRPKYFRSRGRSITLAATASILALLQLIAGPLAAASAASVTPDVTDAGQLERFFDDLMTPQVSEREVPGAVAVVVKDGEVLFTKGWGYADLERGVPMDPERTLIRPGSASKPFVWTAVMQLVEQGRIDLHADINDYLDFVVPATYPEPATMHHLMTHTAGFEAVEDDLFILDESRVPSLRAYLGKHRPARVFKPGMVPGYSNYGTALAAYIVERVSGEQFSAYVDSKVFGPLGMSRSTLLQPVPQTLRADLVQGYGGRDAFVRGDFEYVGPYPAGSASMTAADMSKFMIAHLRKSDGPGVPVLKPDTLELMHRQQYTPDPRLSKMAYGFAEMRSNGRRLLWHGGSTFLHNSALYLFPEENLGVFVAYNGQGGSVVRGGLIDAFMDEFYPAETPRVRPDASSHARNSRYAGEYHFSRSEFTGSGKFVRLLSAAHVTAQEDGRLMVSIEGVSEPYIEVADGFYRHETRDEHLVFKVGADGRTWIHSDGSPSHPTFFATSAFRVPWYESSMLTALVLLLAAVAFLASLLGWGMAAVVRGKAPLSRSAKVRRSIAVAFGVLYWVFLVTLVGTVANVDPAYGVPRAFLGEEPWLLSAAMWIPIVLALLAVAMFAAAGVTWKAEVTDASRWRVLGRVHYGLLSVLAAVASAVLFFWNLNALTG